MAPFNVFLYLTLLNRSSLKSMKLAIILLTNSRNVHKFSHVLTYTPVPLRFWLIVHSLEARFISSGHLRKTIVSQSDESDLCLLTIRSVSDVFGVV